MYGPQHKLFALKGAHLGRSSLAFDIICIPYAKTKIYSGLERSLRGRCVASRHNNFFTSSIWRSLMEICLSSLMIMLLSYFSLLALLTFAGRTVVGPESFAPCGSGGAISSTTITSPTHPIHIISATTSLLTLSVSVVTELQTDNSQFDFPESATSMIQPNSMFATSGLQSTVSSPCLSNLRYDTTYCKS